jgi:formamidopyrimidine-DNA glycosylase
MPELPEVETVARKLRPQLTGARIAAAEILWARTVDRPEAAAFCRMITGARIEDVGRRGKFLRFPLDNDRIWFAHLRMTGKFFISDADEDASPPWNPAHVRARFRLDSGAQLTYVDMRKFGRFYLVADPEEVIGELGPEPLSATFTAERLEKMLEGRRGEIKRLLLNQNFLAGLGNIYASEALWRAQIHPQRSAGTLEREEIRRLHQAIVDALSAGVQHGGTSLDDRQYVYPDGGLGAHQRYLSVYDRAGERCPRCGVMVERMVQGQRSTYYCPDCQCVADQSVSGQYVVEE